MQHPSQLNLTLLPEVEREELPATVVLDLQLFLAETVLIIVVLLVVIVKRTCFDGCRSSDSSSSSSSINSEEDCHVSATDETKTTVKAAETRSPIAEVFEQTTESAEEDLH